MRLSDKTWEYFKKLKKRGESWEKFIKRLVKNYDRNKGFKGLGRRN